jgi:hypothetical protein
LGKQDRRRAIRASVSHTKLLIDQVPVRRLTHTKGPKSKGLEAKKTGEVGVDGTKGRMKRQPPPFQRLRRPNKHRLLQHNLRVADMVVSRMLWKLPSSGLRACDVGSGQAATSRDIGARG